MTISVSRRRSAVGILAALAPLIVLLASCSGHAPGPLGDLQEVHEKVCLDRPFNSDVRIDGTGSAASDAIIHEHLAVVRDVAEETAVCGGTLKVSVFSAGSGATGSVYSGDLTLSAPTLNAKLKRVPETVDTVMAEVEVNLGPAIASLPAGGSDIGSNYRLMGEHAAGSPDAIYRGYLATDGLSNLGSLQVAGPLSPEQAAALAEHVTVPTLPADASITVVGLGRVTGDPVPSNVIEGLVSLYDALCARTGAGTCRSMTDWR